MKKINLTITAALTFAASLFFTGCPGNYPYSKSQAKIHTHTEIEETLKNYPGTFTWTGEAKAEYGYSGYYNFTSDQLGSDKDSRTYTFESSVLKEKGINNGITTVVTAFRYNSVCDYTDFHSLLYKNELKAEAIKQIKSKLTGASINFDNVAFETADYNLFNNMSYDYNISEERFCSVYYSDVEMLLLVNGSPYKDEQKTPEELVSWYSDNTYPYGLRNIALVYYEGTDASDTIQKVFEEKGFNYIFDEKFSEDKALSDKIHIFRHYYYYD